MRKLIYVFVLSLGCGTLFANHGNTTNRYSDLNIKMWDNSSFIITLDHDAPEKTRNFSLKNVAPGDHFVKIVKRKRNYHGYGGFVQTIYQGHINIPSKRKVFVKVEGRNRLSFKFFKKHNQHGNGHRNHDYNNNHQNSYGLVNHLGNSGLGNHSGLVSMNGNSFNQLLDIMKKEHFDDNRLQIAEQAIASNNMNVNQVSAIMDQFTFDDSKLSFAKAAYSNTIDRENYFIVNSKFTFSSSVSDLNNYIRHNA